MSLPILDPVLQKKEIQNENHGGIHISHVNRKQDILSSDAQAALTIANRHFHKLQRPLLAEESRSVESLMINDFRFTTFRQLVHDSAVFFQPLDSQTLVPGYVDSIRVCEKGEDWLIVRRLLPLSKSLATANPFHEYPEFGAELWSDKPSSSIEVVPVSQMVYHRISQPWSKGALVVKCLNRVSYFIIFQYSRVNSLQRHFETDLDFECKYIPYISIALDTRLLYDIYLQNKDTRISKYGSFIHNDCRAIVNDGSKKRIVSSET